MAFRLNYKRIDQTQNCENTLCHPRDPMSISSFQVKSGWDAFKSLWNVVQKSAEELGHQVDTQTSLLEQLQYSLENAG